MCIRDRDRDPTTGRNVMSVTVTDRLPREILLIDNGGNSPALICIANTAKSNTSNILAVSVEKRIEMCLGALRRIFPLVDIESHLIGEPIVSSWENNSNFTGAFRNVPPGDYRYSRRLYTHFMQEKLTSDERGIFIAGDDVSWTPGWVEGAVNTALNAVWGTLNHLGGSCHLDNPGPGDVFESMMPVNLDS